jgi:hypothetical protein
LKNNFLDPLSMSIFVEIEEKISSMGFRSRAKIVIFVIVLVGNLQKYNFPLLFEPILETHQILYRSLMYITT